MVILQVEGMESELDTLEKKREKAQQGKSMTGIHVLYKKNNLCIEYPIHNFTFCQPLMEKQEIFVSILKHQVKFNI